MKYRYFSDTITLNLDTQKCTGCGICALVCPHGIFSVTEGKAQITDKSSCMECGACSKNCAFNAITTNRGVGCAVAIINGIRKGAEPSCDCSGNNSETFEV